MQIGTTQAASNENHVLAAPTDAPVRIYSLVLQGANNTSAIVLTPDENGTEVARVKLPGTATVGYLSFREGLLVTGGCVVQTDADTVYATITYAVEG